MGEIQDKLKGVEDKVVGAGEDQDTHTRILEFIDRLYAKVTRSNKN
jgi:hypothetical protein